ncbi:MAG: hypothetical protein OEV33_00915 [Armatimonadota bacterium]|nr:hypothetical protein [Armatimonadota bacterium]
MLGDIVVAAVALVFLAHRALTQPDPIEKLAMSLLALVVIGISLFEGWTWRGRLRPSAETTSTYIAIALDRSLRLQKSLRAGWPLLAAEVLIFTPWIWYQLHADGTAPSYQRSLFAWGFLIAMVGTGALAVSVLQRWAKRDARRLEELRRETGGDE